MATDLTTVKDHPSQVLIDHRDLLVLRPAVNDREVAGVERAARYLRTYETTAGVTFAALDTDALAGVRDSYRDTFMADAGNIDPIIALRDFRNEVEALLGLADD